MSLDVRAVAVPSLGTVKMEDRKRSVVSEQDDLAPPAKRQALSANSNGAKAHPDADLPWKDDLETFQKDAIIRQMREYKREKQACEAQIAEMEKKAAHHDDHLRIIDSWFSQLLDEIKILVNDTALHKPQETNDAIFPPSLLFADSEKFQKHLSDRSEKIKDALSGLLSRSPSEASDSAQLQEQLSRILSQEKVHIVELNRMSVEKEALRERLEKASYRYMVAEKKLDRAKSQAVAKVERQAMQGATASSGDDSGSTKKESPADVNGMEDSPVATDELLLAKKEAESIALKRKEQLDTLEAENQKLTGELTQLKVKLSGLTDEDYAKTELFKAMKSQYDDVIRNINHLTSTNVTLREEAQRLHAERTAYRIQVDEEIRTTLQENEAQLSKAETDLIRIRTGRDELLADLAVRKASSEEHKASVAQMQELAKASEDRIKALELEVERLRLQLGEQRASEPSPEIVDMEVDQLRARLTSLEKEYALVTEELPSMVAALKKTQAVAAKKTSELVSWEEQVSRLSAEKAKADQKYFSAMRYKDAKEQENRTLRAQNIKSAEIVTQLKDAETTSRNLAVNLEKQLVECKEAIANVTNTHRTLQQKMTEHAITSEGFVSQIAELKKVVSAKDATVVTSSKAQREAEVKAEELQSRLDDSNKQIGEWKARSLGKQTDTEGQLRRMLLCTICQKNWKDTCIKLCGHVYCRDCVEQRIIDRARKCPGCGKSFGNNDVMRIHLTG